MVVFPIGVCLWRREWKLALALAAGPLLAVVGFGLCSKLVGMPFVPNSIILKGKAPAFLPDMMVRVIDNLCNGTPAIWDLFALTCLAGIVLRIKVLRESTQSLQLLLWCVVTTCCIHAGLATIGIYYRYEAYLSVLLLIVLFLSIQQILKLTWKGFDQQLSTIQWLAAIPFAVCVQIGLAEFLWTYRYETHITLSVAIVTGALLATMILGVKTRFNLMRVLVCSGTAIACFMVVVDRARIAHIELPLASRDIYLQQYQMGRFIARYYPEGKLAANDIGAVSYYSHIHLLDLVGLASDEIRVLRKSHRFGTETLGAKLAAFDPDVVIIYKEWFSGRDALPNSMILVSQWTIPPNTTAAKRTICFYAPNLEKAKLLSRRIIEFQKSLPSRVDVVMFHIPTSLQS